VATKGRLASRSKSTQTKFFSLSAPASWLFQRAEAKGSVKGARWVRVHRSECGDPLRVLPPLPSPLLEAGALDEGRKLVYFLIAARLYAQKGRRCGQDTGPHGWEAENASAIGGCSGGRAEHPSQQRQSPLRNVVTVWSLFSTRNALRMET
jgi:hypothetical protein